jgi:acyl dehydratase
MYFEDLPVGATFTTASRELTREAILDFARQWDPQPFHLDDAAAAQSPYGAIIASGFHTILTAFNLTLEAVDWSQSSMGSPGMKEVRWIKPVYPGDSLHVHCEVLSAKASRSKPDRGFVDLAYTVLNQRDEIVATYQSTLMLRRKPAD